MPVNNETQEFHKLVDADRVMRAIEKFITLFHSSKVRKMITLEQLRMLMQHVMEHAPEAERGTAYWMRSGWSEETGEEDRENEREYFDVSEDGHVETQNAPAFCSACHKFLVASDEYNMCGRFCLNCGCRMENRAPKKAEED